MTVKIKVFHFQALKLGYDIEEDIQSLLHKAEEDFTERCATADLDTKSYGYKYVINTNYVEVLFLLGLNKN